MIEDLRRHITHQNNQLQPVQSVARPDDPATAAHAYFPAVTGAGAGAALWEEDAPAARRTVPLPGVGSGCCSKGYRHRGRGLNYRTKATRHRL